MDDPMDRYDKMKALWDVCTMWRDKHKPLCGESIYQRDSVNQACPELAEAVCDVIGYTKTDDF